MDMLESARKQKRRSVVNGIDVHVGSQIRTRRLALGLSEQELASLLGAPVEDVMSYEAGRKRLVPSVLYAMTKALEVNIGWFFFDVDPEHWVDESRTAVVIPMNAAIAASQRDADCEILGSIARQMDAATREKLIAIAKTLSR
ncbi:MAG: helix-turn-helix domain-containing protein [Bradyrhizobium sp.]|uniref:helix-turn-helix domain-containing protein n=1 Tax=Bradyrhizobium sp. TaxID=376 RepID=UPI003D113F2E